MRRKGEMMAKLTGVLKKLRDYRVMCNVAVYLDILEKLSPLSLIFEQKTLMLHEVKPAVQLTTSNLNDLSEETVDDLIDSSLLKFKIKDENDFATLESMYLKAGHELKNPSNRESIEVS